MRFGSVKAPSRAFDAYVPAEMQRATELGEEGFISDLCLEERKEHAILVLNNTNRDEVQWRLATLHVIEMQMPTGTQH